VYGFDEIGGLSVMVRKLVSRKAASSSALGIGLSDLSRATATGQL
jgi:hypothetical protein